MASRIDGLARLAAGMLQPGVIRLAMTGGHRRVIPRQRLWRPVVVALVGHRHWDVVVVVVLLDDEPGVGLFIDELELLGLELLVPFAELSDEDELLDGELDDETVPLADIEAEVDVSVDGVVVVVVVVLELGDEVSVDAVVVEGLTATVVDDPGVALAPELL
jgi:hypothetical protein